MTETVETQAVEPTLEDADPLPFWVVAIGIAIFVIGLELLNWLSGEGLFPTIGALRATTAGTASVDISGGLWFTCMGLVWIGLAAIARLTGISAQRSWVLWSAIAIVIGAGVALDLYGVEPALGRFMTDHGYSRCPAKDHDTYIGRGAHIYFQNYVRSANDCATA